MKKVNLRDLYPDVYKNDHFVEVTEDVLEAIRATERAEAACAEYDAIIKRVGGIDLQLLGIGHDGHIGFNEPADHFPVNTHCVDLTEETIEANKRFFASKEDVPRQAYIIGKTPAGRWGEAEDLAGPAVFLASDASNFVNGHILYVDGGILAYIGKQP